MATRANEITQAEWGEQLDRSRERLESARADVKEATSYLYDLIELVRGTFQAFQEGPVTVQMMADVMERDRNYVDSVWSDRDPARKVYAEWFGLPATCTPDRLLSELKSVSDKQKQMTAKEVEVRRERDALVVEAYRNKILGPGRIAQLIGVDRNHVGRICRRAGVGPVHRKNVRNQYTAGV